MSHQFPAGLGRRFMSTVLAAAVALAATLVVLSAGISPASAAPAFANTGATAISAGSRHACAIVGGSVYCWGKNDFGQLGDGTTTDRANPVAVSDSGSFTNANVTSISAGSSHTCAVAAGEVFCWGLTADNQTGFVGGAASCNQLVFPENCFTTAQKVADGAMTNSSITSVSAGDKHTCAIKNANGGEVYCWGAKFSGRLGDGLLGTGATPVKVSAGAMTNSGITAIDVNFNHTCAIKNANGGEVYCWGPSTDGRLGDGQVGAGDTPVKVSAGAMTNSNIASVATGSNHSCAIKGGAVYCWGSEDYGQLGNDVTGLTTKTTPVSVSTSASFSNSNVSVLSSTERFSCVIATVSDEVYCWGGFFNGTFRGLGNGTTSGSKTAVKVSDGEMTNSNVDDISIGWNGQDGGFACAVKNSEIFCWGGNSHGQLGIGTGGAAGPKTSPTKVLAAVGQNQNNQNQNNNQNNNQNQNNVVVRIVSLYWTTIDVNGGSCRVDGAAVISSLRTPFLGYRYLPSADECSKSGYVFGGWAQRSDPGTIMRFPRLIDMNDGLWRFFIVDSYDLVAVWVTPTGSAVFES